MPGAFVEYGVDDGDRTHDNRSHNPVLYQLSYAHHIAFCLYQVANGAPGRTRTCDHPLRRRMLYPAELRALMNLHSFEAQTKSLVLRIFRFSLPPHSAAAVLEKRGKCYRGRHRSSTLFVKKIREIRTLRKICPSPPFAPQVRHARMRTSFPLPLYWLTERHDRTID
jgi:hypothetical protein